MFKREIQPGGTVIIRQVIDHHAVANGLMPEATKELLRQIHGEVNDGQQESDGNGSPTGEQDR